MEGACQINVTVFRATTAVSCCGAPGGADGVTVTTKVVVAVVGPSSLAMSVIVDVP